MKEVSLGRTQERATPQKSKGKRISERKWSTRLKIAEAKKCPLFCRALVTQFQCGGESRSQNGTGSRGGVKTANTLTGILGLIFQQTVLNFF